MIHEGRCVLTVVSLYQQMCSDCAVLTEGQKVTFHRRAQQEGQLVLCGAVTSQFENKYTEHRLTVVMSRAWRYQGHVSLSGSCETARV